MNEDVEISLTHDEALVLFEWLAGSGVAAKPADSLDPPQQRVLWDLEARLERSLPEVLDPNYQTRVKTALSRVVSSEKVTDDPGPGQFRAMKLLSLGAGDTCSVVAHFETPDDQTLRSVFTITSEEIPVVNAVPNVLSRAGLSVDQIRAMVAAVIAFERARSSWAN